jgi:hypothetical protein
MNINVDIAKCVRRLPSWHRTYPLIRIPSWARADPLRRLWQDSPTLLERGKVVWAHMIQANELLFAPGNDDCPGEIVYDPTGIMHPGDLSPVAGKLFSLKGTVPSGEDFKEIATYLTDERVRVFGLRVPIGVSEYPLSISTIFFCRKHLPNGVLSLPYFPILISEACPGSTMVLPSLWWPVELVRLWSGRR